MCLQVETWLKIFTCWQYFILDDLLRFQSSLLETSWGVFVKGNRNATAATFVSTAGVSTKTLLWLVVLFIVFELYKMFSGHIMSIQYSSFNFLFVFKSYFEVFGMVIYSTYTVY